MRSIVCEALFCCSIFIFCAIFATNAVTFSSVTQFGGREDDGSNSDMFSWAVGVPSLKVQITSSDLVVTSGSTAIPTLKVELTDGSEPVSCALLMNTACDSSACTSPAITCNLDSSSGLVIEFTLPELTAAYHNARLLFTISGSVVTDWNFETKTFSLSECGSSLLGATAKETLPTPCGYNCNSDFDCNAGFTGSGFAGVCNAVGEWDATNTCVEICNINDNCTNCVIAGGTTPIAVGEKKNATCIDTFSSPRDPQELTCEAGGAPLIFDLQCNAPCPVNVTCQNCENLHAVDFPPTIKEGENVTVRCLNGSGNGSEPQVSVCSGGNTVNVDITCDPSSNGAVIAFGCGFAIALLFKATSSGTAGREHQSSNKLRTKVEKKTDDSVVVAWSDSNQKIYTFNKLAKHNITTALPSPSPPDEKVVERDTFGRLSWPEKNGKQTYGVLTFRGQTVVDEKIVTEPKYTHWTASHADDTHVIVAIGQDRKISDPVFVVTGRRYLQVLWAFALWMVSVVLVIVGIGLLAGQFAKCRIPDPAACALIDLAVPGLVLVVLAVAIDLGLIIWVVKLTCCPTEPAEKNGDNSEPEATRMMTENV